MEFLTFLVSLTGTETITIGAIQVFKYKRMEFLTFLVSLTGTETITIGAIQVFKYVRGWSF